MPRPSPDHEELAADLADGRRRIQFAPSAEVVLRNWSEFESKIKELQSKRQKMHGVGQSYVSNLLFRGHSDSSWRLQTTLERHTDKITIWEDYLELARSLIPSIKAGRWAFPRNVSSWCNYTKGFNPFDVPPAFRYLIYLRHHGFPSPLLDWSQSAWVAAYFAFAAPGNQPRAIYAFIEDAGHGKAGSLSRSSIHSYGWSMSRLARHVRQKAEYTSCVKFVDGVRTICDHEEVFARNNPMQDRLWKFVLPASDRINVLKHLDSYHLNAETLFLTDDRLLETLALRNIDFR